MLLAEDMPLAERVRKGNALFRTRQRDVEDTLAQLVHDESQEVAATAIQLVEARKLWSLAGDLEHVAGAPVGQGLVGVRGGVVGAGGAADAAGAAPRRCGRSRCPPSSWPIACAASGCSTSCRSTSCSAWPASGARCATRSAARWPRRARRPTSLHFVLDGRVAVQSARGGRAEIAAPGVINFEDVLEGHPVRGTATALEPTITLSMTTEEFLTLVSENVEIAQGIFRLLLETRCAPAWRTVVHGELTPELQRRVADGVQALDGLILLQSSPLLHRATSSELVRLAAVARVVPLTTGATLFKPGDSAAIHAILTGQLTVAADGAAGDVAEGGDVVGIYEALSGRFMTSQGTVATAGSALRIDRGDLFELMADNIPLLQGIFSGLLHAGPAALPAAEAAHTHAAT